MDYDERHGVLCEWMGSYREYSGINVETITLLSTCTRFDGFVKFKDSTDSIRVHDQNFGR